MGAGRMIMPEHVIEIEHLSKHYTGVIAVEDLSFRVQRGASCSAPDGRSFAVRPF
jgi:ABC-type sugar transport system ATPase subunit